MTPDERAVLDSLVEAWNLFLRLPTEHPDDQLEFRQSIHAAQTLLLARPTRRELNG